MVSDIALLKELPSEIKGSIAAYVGCVAGATTREEYLATVASAGFKDVEVVNEISAKGIYSSGTAQAIAENLGTSSGLIEEAADSIISIQISAVKPN